MKLKHLLLTAFIALFIPLSAYAAIGDVTGHIYTTDIAAFVDDMPIKSYNIGGRTAIIMEDLRQYGFYVEWNEETRWLTVKTEPVPYTSPSNTHIPQTPGNIAGDIYETDIRVSVNGIEVPSFCLDGVTAVAIENMVDLPIDRYSYDGNPFDGMEKPYSETAMYYVWNNEERTISLNCLRPQGKLATDYGEFTVNLPRLETEGYVHGAKSFAGMDGLLYNYWIDYLEINSKLYIPLANATQLIDTVSECLVSYGDDNSIIVTADMENYQLLRYGTASTSRSSSNILCPVNVNMTFNGTAVNDFYAHKGKLYISLEALNAASGRDMFKYQHELPDGCTEKLGKILPTKDIVYINDYAVNSLLADNGEYYIPVDDLADAGFDIIAKADTRSISSPQKSPDFSNRSDNIPSTYYLTDYENKGYLYEFYNSLHTVTLDDISVSSVYIHSSDTLYTPCIALDELVKAGGYTMNTDSGRIWVYTREDKFITGEDDNSLWISADGKKVIKFPATEYNDIRIWGDFIAVRRLDYFSEVYDTSSLKLLFTINGHINDIKNDTIFTIVPKTENGKFIHEVHTYDMQGNFLSSDIIQE